MLDWALAERVLLQVIENEANRYANVAKVSVEGHSDAEVAQILEILDDAGLIKANVLRSNHGPEEGFVERITAAGHLAATGMASGTPLQSILTGTRTQSHTPPALSAGQRELLTMMIEAEHAAGKSARFVYTVTHSSRRLYHSGFGDDGFVEGDFDADLDGLVAADFLIHVPGRQGRRFTLHQSAFAWYERHAKDDVVRHVEESVERFLDGPGFRDRFPKAYEYLRQARTQLTAPNSLEQATVLGHRVREAAIAFATELVERYKPPDADPNPMNFVKRVGSVIAHLTRPDGSENAMLVALGDLWEATNDAIQRQEHNAQREAAKGERLAWEDGRRLLFITTVAMHEICRSCERAAGR